MFEIDRDLISCETNGTTGQSTWFGTMAQIRGVGHVTAGAHAPHRVIGVPLKTPAAQCGASCVG